MWNGWRLFPYNQNSLRKQKLYGKCRQPFQPFHIGRNGVAQPNRCRGVLVKKFGSLLSLHHLMTTYTSNSKLQSFVFRSKARQGSHAARHKVPVFMPDLSVANSRPTLAPGFGTTARPVSPLCGRPSNKDRRDGRYTAFTSQRAIDTKFFYQISPNVAGLRFQFLAINSKWEPS